MGSRNGLELVEVGIARLSRGVSYVGMAVLVVMMLLTVADVFMRYVINRPILGALELTEYMMVPVVFLGLAWCAKQGGNVKVDLFTARLKPSIQTILDGVVRLFSVVVVSVIAWQNLGESVRAWKVHKASDMLGVPAYPFYLVLGVGCFLLCLVLLLELVQLIVKDKRGRG